jgi:hypothetical protein
MSQMNPVTGSILQTSVMQKQQTGEKVQQARHQQDLRKNVAAREDEVDLQVQNAEELVEADGDHSNPKNPKKNPPRKPKNKPETPDDGEEKSHIDMTA